MHEQEQAPEAAAATTIAAEIDEGDWLWWLARCVVDGAHLDTIRWGLLCSAHRVPPAPAHQIVLMGADTNQCGYDYRNLACTCIECCLHGSSSEASEHPRVMTIVLGSVQGACSTLRPAPPSSSGAASAPNTRTTAAVVPALPAMSVTTSTIVSPKLSASPVISPAPASIAEPKLQLRRGRHFPGKGGCNRAEARAKT